MPDFGEKGEALTAMDLQLAMKHINTAREVEATGRCLNCDNALDDPTQRWCDGDCRDDWEKINKGKLK